ncbi:hypothetical protein IFM89_020301 [Coptis chinensis]|uniref:PPPDE domain-containing protein n=1 Tax=Coptis chinensis TaxID=261450 RepID=A0A835HMB6_9MAGN|nr:hypothetical protein IFM89_020301 [Coptis chinensis]
MTTEVALHIYDVTNSGSDKTNNTIVQINKIFKDGIGLGGIFHSAVQTQAAFRIFNQMRFNGIKPDVFTLSSLIKGCNGDQCNKSAHVVCLKMGYSSGPFVCSGLIDNYSKLGDIDSAEKCFQECVVVDTVVWTTMISGYLFNAEPKMSRKLFMEMWTFGMVLNQFTLTSILGALSDIKEGRQIHCLSIKMCWMLTPLRNATMSMYCHCGSKADGAKMFAEISEPDVVSWATRIGASYDGEEALELFRFLRLSNKEVNEYTIINVLSEIEGSRFLETGKQIQAHCYKTGYLPIISISNALISMYGRCQCSGEARMVFDEMVKRDCVSWNALLAGYAESGLIELTLEMYSKMRRSLLKENQYTIASILDVLSNSKAQELTKEIHAHIIKSGFMSDDSMVTCLIRAYGSCRDIEKATHLFSEICQIDVVHVNAILATLVHAGYYDDALKIFQDTGASNVAVDDVTISILLKSCGALAMLEQVRVLHSLSLKSGTSQGNFDDNLAAWNAMIMGYAQHGYAEQVFALFSEMTRLGNDVDEITCLGFLYSCSHSGRVKEACSFLNTMSEIHGLVPQLEHYACLVDLLGRVGELEEAKRIIDQMPIVPDAQIWQILLSACTIHGNVELGKVVSLKLLKLQPKNDSAHVALSNLHASIGVWDEVGRLREVYGDEEWSFGFCEQGSGVFSCPPSKNPMYTYRERMVLGKTDCSIFEVNQILRELSREWPGSSYDLLSRNCNHFCDELCERLGVPKLPGWVNRFANAGDAAMEVAGNTAVRLRQAKAEVVSASKVAYRFLSGVTNNNSTSIGSPDPSSNSSRDAPRIQATWFRNLMSMGTKPSTSEIEANNEDRTELPQQSREKVGQNSLHSV